MSGAALIVAPFLIADAATSVTGFDPWQLIGYGLTPLSVVALILSGWLVPKRDHERALDDNTALRQELATEREQVRTSLERVIAETTRATLVMERIVPLLETETHVRRRARDD